MGELSQSAMTIKVRAPVVLFKFAIQKMQTRMTLYIAMRKTFIMAYSVLYDGRL